MLLPFLVVSAIVPAILLVWFFQSRDLHREPARVVWATFGLGVAVLVPECVVAALLAPIPGGLVDPFASSFAAALLTAALPEEAFKLLVVTGYCMRHREFDEPMDGIVYGAVTGLGFACLENVLYVTRGSLGEAVLRALTAVPNHACLGAIMGYFVGRAKFAPTGRRGLFARALLLPVALHTLYDFPLLTLGSFAKKGQAASMKPVLLPLLLVTAVVLLGELAWTARLVRRTRREQEEVLARWRAYWAARGVVPPPGAYPRATPMIAEAPARVRAGPVTAGVWVAAVAGFLSGSLGGIVVLGTVMIATRTPEGHAAPSVGGLLALGVTLGALPLAAGLALFRFALKRIRGVPVRA